MSKYSAEIGGFTMAPDVIIKELGLVTACVYGKVWRYEQMTDDVCRAAIETLAGELGVSYNTILAHIAKLIKAGYLRDMTPNLRNRPHIYKTTGKLGIEINVVSTPQKLQTSKIAEQNLMPHSSKIGDESDSLRDSLIEDEEEQTTQPRPNVYKVYEQEIGPLTPMIAQSLDDLAKEHGEQWCISAIREASAHGARNLKYIQAILKRWAVQGYGSENKKPAQAQRYGKQAEQSKPKSWGVIEQMASEMGVQL